MLRALLLLSAASIAGCASQSGSIGPTSALTPPPSAPQAAETVSRLPPPEGGGYRLTETELELDCRKLTGRMAVRIVQIRDFQSRSQSTALSRGIQTATAPVLGGHTAGTDPGNRYARDRAQLEAFNRRLAEKDCANFDLDAELSPTAKDPPRTRPVNRS